MKRNYYCRFISKSLIKICSVRFKLRSKSDCNLSIYSSVNNVKACFESSSLNITSTIEFEKLSKYKDMETEIGNC